MITMQPVLEINTPEGSDHRTGVAFLPGCCDGLEDWRDWHALVDGGSLLGFGHEPVSPIAERFGDAVRLTVNAERSDSPVIGLTVTGLRRLLGGVERDLTAFLATATVRARQRMPEHAGPVVAALARVLDLPAPAVPPEP
ncbi:hypothetical protein ACIQ9P_36170 [Kitasatospora sp. NPDC094019]|uniref:hypothetical protein n=1 Tax=Kitasatospora sp. NPDC094019 TaxID=3364091 RepID=UPI00382D70BF